MKTEETLERRGRNQAEEGDRKNVPEKGLAGIPHWLGGKLGWNKAIKRRPWESMELFIQGVEGETQGKAILRGEVKRRRDWFSVAGGVKRQVSGGLRE